MTIDEVKQTIDRFYSAETSAYEEEQLKQFFLNHDVTQELQTDKQFFDALFGTQPQEPAGMGQRLSHEIDRWNALEKSYTQKMRTENLKWVSGIAACLLLLLSLGTFLNTRQQTAATYTSMPQETYDNPVDAASETERALIKFSQALNVR